MNISAPISSFITSIISPQILLPNATAAALLAVMNVTTAISVAALVFSGPLSPYLSTGIGLFLIGSAIGGVLVAAGSSYKAVIAGPRSGQAPIVASLVAAIALAMQGQPGEAVIATAVAAILAATLFIGVVLFGLGWAKLGMLARYIPYPVMGGFFAGLGFLLFKGGVLVALGPIVSLADPASFLTMKTAIHLAPALLFAVLFYVLDQRYSHWLLMPSFLLVTIIIFYSVMFATGTTVEMAGAQHWLPSIDTANANFFPVFTPDQLALVNWPVILAQSGTILVMTLMSVIMVLLDTSGIEIVLDRDMDPNHELKVAGGASVLTGLCTGPLIIQAAADTAFVYKLGATRFIMVLIYGALVIGAIMVGPGPIAYAPTLILGGLLMYIGIDFLMSWVWQARKKLPLKDFAVVCLILFVVAAYGILEGVAVGVVLAILLFVHSYSQLSVIKANMSGAEHVSNIDRNRKQSQYLDQHGDELHIFVLQGFLFFGTASRLLEDIRALLDSPERATIRYLIMDFHRVDAMDTSAVNSFAKLIQVCRKGGVVLVLTGSSPDVGERLQKMVDDNPGSSDNVRLFDDLDEGVAWCDDRILEGFIGDDDEDDPVKLLSFLLGDLEAAKIISPQFEQVSVGSGEVLFRQGDPGDSLYLVLNGSVSVVLDLPNGQTLHLRTMRAGAILGEMALYTGAARSATAVINDDARFYRLGQDEYKHMNETQPAAAGLFHSFIVRLMSERLGRANKEIMALSR